MAPDDEDEIAPGSASWPGQWAGRDGSDLRGLWPILVACAVVAAGWQWHWRDKLALLNSRQAEHAALHQSAARLAAEAASAEPMRRRLAELTQALTVRERHLPDHGGIDELLVTLSSLANAHGLRIALFQPQAAVVGADFVQIPLTLRVDGGYREIAAWLAGLAALPRLVTLQSMQLAAGKDDGALTMEAVVLAYRALDAAERAAPQRTTRASRGKGGHDAAPPPTWHPAPLDPAPRLPLLQDANAGAAGAAVADLFADARLAAPAFAPSDDAVAARAREPLEAYALEQMRMVGSLQSAGRAYGVVRVDGADGLVAAVQVGQRLGRRDGVVVRIERDGIVLRERVWNGEDRWIETTARLALDAPA
ncbi:pilus assembly protein PilP [Cupriavidus gilardii]|uniref:pilus assembly protein PilP n=1 Tax=Cupriavidus gilardii TaxID=82541 RepID=UPI001ABDFD2C|nr:pilus assembly protein PilP [Cupriavidus gilardii]MBO4121858.1 pilus assembly protein PilP [Cupriavidus gilardii]